MPTNEHQGFTTKTYLSAASFGSRSVLWYSSDNFVKSWLIASRKMETYPGLVLAHWKSDNWISVQVCLKRAALSQVFSRCSFCYRTSREAELTTRRRSTWLRCHVWNKIMPNRVLFNTRLGKSKINAQLGLPSKLHNTQAASSHCTLPRNHSLRRRLRKKRQYSMAIYTCVVSIIL